MASTTTLDLMERFREWEGDADLAITKWHWAVSSAHFALSLRHFQYIKLARLLEPLDASRWHLEAVAVADDRAARLRRLAEWSTDVAELDWEHAERIATSGWGQPPR